MSPRERWIVYPLLFFSFGLAIRDQVPEWRPKPNFNVVTCRHLIVRDARGGEAVEIYAKRSGPNAGSGVVKVKTGMPKVGTAKTAAIQLAVMGAQSDGSDRYGVVQTFGPLGSEAVRLVGDQSGGALEVFDPNGKPKRLVALFTPSGRSPAEQPADDDDPRKAIPRPPKPEQDEADRPNEEGLSVEDDTASTRSNVDSAS